MPVVALMNMKGGVGKTTLCVNLADALTREFDKSVLLVDVDPQFNATQCFMAPDEYIKYRQADGFTVKNVFATPYQAPSLVNGNSTLDESSEEPTIFRSPNGVDLLPGDLELVVNQESQHGQEWRLKRFIQKHRLEDRYDYIFIDCPPTNSLWTISATLAADYYVLPVKPDHLSSVGLSLFRSVVNGVREDYACNISCAGVVFTMVTPTNLSSRVMANVRADPSLAPYVYEAHLRQTTQIAQLSERQGFILDLSEPSHPADLRRIAREFLGRVE